MKTRTDLALLTNIPAPYRVPVWNQLAPLTDGGLKVRFIGTSDARRRCWTIPATEMKFRWEFLSHPKGHAEASFGQPAAPPLCCAEGLGLSARRDKRTKSNQGFDALPERRSLSAQQGGKAADSRIASRHTDANAPPFQLTASNEQSRTQAAALIELRAAFAMLRFLMRQQPNAVICGGYDSLAAWTSFAWCALARRRFVLWLEGTTRDLRPRGALRTWLKRLIVSRADAIAASGKATVEYLRELGAHESNIFLAPFGGDHESFGRAAGAVDAAGEKKRLGYPRHLVLYSGRLVREKGVMVLLEAFRRVASELPDAGLLLAGDGPAHAEMVDFCRRSNVPRVFFAGVQEYHQMPRFYALADVLVLPTFSDTWGYVVNEAFACGVPAIVSRVAGVCDDLILEGETGFTAEPGDAEQLAGRMRLLLTDERLRSRMSANCRRAIVPYSAEACAEGLLAAAEGGEAGVRSQESEARRKRGQEPGVAGEKLAPFRPF